MPTYLLTEYYRSRAQASVAMSHAAAESGIRKIHLELARRYVELAGVSDQSLVVGLASRRDGGEKL